MRNALVLLFIAFFAPRLWAQEPTGGVITNLVFFDDSVNTKVGMGGIWSFAQSSAIDSTVAHDGLTSYRYELNAWNGAHHVWRGVSYAADQSWLGPDSAVFWIQDSSRLHVWVRSSSPDCQIRFDLEAGEIAAEVIPLTPIGPESTWVLIDVPIPPEAKNQPMKNLKMYTGGVDQTLWIDNLVIENVRLYAGLGPPTPANFPIIAASQIGYLPNMPKVFSSPAPFNSFEVQRVSDSTTVLTGNGPSLEISSTIAGNRSVWFGDFSGLSIPGRYRIIAGTRQSYPFDIGTNIFDQPIRAVQRMFYYQRAFTAITMPYAEGPWVHPSDSALAPAGVVCGWHDAGDLTVYFPTMAQTIQHLLDAWTDFRPMSDSTNIPESGNGIPDLLDEARWGLRWILSMQDSCGGFWTIACANGTGSGYVYGTNPPIAGTRPTDVLPYTKVTLGTPSTAKGIAVLAYASVAFRPFDTTFANTCLAAACRGWAWLSLHPEITADGTCNAYPTNGDTLTMKTQKMWAAAAMLYATGQLKYDTVFTNNFVNPDWIPSYGLTHAYAASLYLRAAAGNPTRKAQIIQEFQSMADGVRSDAAIHPFSAGIYYYWGSLNNALQRTANFSWRAYLLDSTRRNDLYQGLNNVNYVFGRNYLTKCYVSGLTSATDGMKESFHFWLKALNATPHDFPGMMGAGPNQDPAPQDYSYPDVGIWGYFGDPRYLRTGVTALDARYTDNDSWSTNEQVISWDAVLLYNLYAAKMRGASAPVTAAYVDSAYSPGNAGSHVFGYDAHNTINGGVNLVASGGTVYIAAGTYPEAITINKNLTLVPSGTPAVRKVDLTGGKSLTLGGTIKVTDTLSLTNGVITTGSNKIIINCTNTHAGAVVFPSPGGSVNGTVERTIGADSTGTYKFTSDKTYIKPAPGQPQATFTITAHANTSPIPAVATSSVVKRYYEIATTVPTFVPNELGLAFSYPSEGYTGMNTLSLALWRNCYQNCGGSPPAWRNEGGIAFPAPYYVIANAITGWASNWAIAEQNSPLAIQLTSFTGTRVSNTRVRLDWATASETNNYGFYIERKGGSDSTFTPVPNSFVPGHGTTNTPQRYMFSDSSASQSFRYWRLKQVDLDNTVHYSDAIQVTTTDVKDVAPIEFSLKQNYPNPFNPTTEIKFSVEQPGRATLEVFNILGQRVASLFNNAVEPGQYYHVRFDGRNLASGIYFYRLQSGRRTDLKKLLLLK